MPLRHLIAERLASYEPGKESVSQTLLANVEGPISPELRQLIASPGQQASVLVGFIERVNGLQVILTERAGHLSVHAGQVAFPGGRVESGDTDSVATALREAHEEIGLDPNAVTVLRALAAHATGTGFVVTPVVGLVDESFVPAPDAAEVAAVFEVPAELALDSSSYEISYRQRFGTRFRSYSLTYGGREIWGATAAILVNLGKILY